MDSIARRLEAPIVVDEVTERSAFLALQPEWDALVSRSGRDEIFHRHVFIRVWLDNFAREAPWRILVARSDDGRLMGVLPLVESRTALYGIPVRELGSASNPHSCRFDLVSEDPGRVALAFLRHLDRDESWDVLRLADVPEGGLAWRLHDLARADGHPHGTWESLQSPYVPLPSTKESLFKGLDSKFKANLRRRRRKLEEKGAVTFERVTEGVELWAKLEEGLALEQGGWKGERGTAINQDAATRGFYLELARNLSHSGQLVLSFLRLEGRAVAFHFALEHNGRYLLLKPGYDESLKECSPGQLLMEEVLSDCIQRGFRELDFLGPDMVWKRDWTQRVRVHTWLYVFRRTTFGRALQAAKFRWAPAAKEVVSRWNW